MFCKESVIIILFVVFCQSVFSQTTIDSRDIQIARKKLQVGVDTSRYVTTTTHAITPSSTHRQLPTAKAVYDVVRPWRKRTFSAPVSGFFITLTDGLPPADLSTILFYRNGIELSVGPPGCSDCGAVWDATNTRFILQRSIILFEKFKILTNG